MTAKRNALSRELMHAKATKDDVGIYVNTDNIPFTNDEREAYRRKTVQLYGSPFSLPTEDKTARIRYANRLWYLKNKQWKHDYNKSYYEANKEYWAQRYRKAAAEKRAAENPIKVEKKDGYTKITIGNDDVEYDVAKANYERAIKDYQFYMDNNKRMPITKAWSDGAAVIKNVGNKFMNKFMNTSSPVLSELAKSVKGLFSR
jgi:hypothetical protein